MVSTAARMFFWRFARTSRIAVESGFLTCCARAALLNAARTATARKRFIRILPVRKQHISARGIVATGGGRSLRIAAGFTPGNSSWAMSSVTFRPAPVVANVRERKAVFSGERCDMAKPGMKLKVLYGECNEEVLASQAASLQKAGHTVTT